MRSLFICLSVGLSIRLLLLPLHADTFGSGANQFTIKFVELGNAGNGNDRGAGGGIYMSRFGGVAYDYRISTYEISQEMIVKAATLGMANVVAGAWTGNQPAADMSWYEAAAFVNWLNMSQGYSAAYNLAYNGEWSMSLWGASAQAGTGVSNGTNPYRHQNAFYFLPSEHEWCKAAYHQNDGVTANYWDYPTGGNGAPDGIDSAGDADYEAVFRDGYNDAAPNSVYDVGSGASPYGTFGQGGNLKEWMESASDGVNDDPSDGRAVRGGVWYDGVYALRSSQRHGSLPTGENFNLGFRVASIIPEPTTFTLLGLGSLVLVMVRRKR